MYKKKALSGPLRELFITKFKSQFKRGFTKVVCINLLGSRRDLIQAVKSTKNLEHQSYNTKWCTKDFMYFL